MLVLSRKLGEQIVLPHCEAMVGRCLGEAKR